MKFFLIYIIFLFSTCSLFADRGAEFRDAVYNVDLTQPLGNQLEQDVFKEFENLVNPYSYFTEFAVLPIDLKNHNPIKFGKTLSQEQLLEQYGHLIFNEAPQTLVLKSGGRCACNSEDNRFYVHLDINKRKAQKLSAAAIPLFKPVKACIETDDGILVILYVSGEIEVFEFFNRNMFKHLLLEQLIVLVNLYEISEPCPKDVANGKRSVLIHPDWYKIFKKIPTKVIKYMFTDSIHVSANGYPEDFTYTIYDNSSKELGTQIKALQSIFNKKKLSCFLREPESEQAASEDRVELPPIATAIGKRERILLSGKKPEPNPKQPASDNQGIDALRLPPITIFEIVPKK